MVRQERGEGPALEPNLLRRPPYKEYLPGDELTFTIETLQPDGVLNTRTQRVTIADVFGGGFFGRVLIPEGQDFVIKTSLPDPWHHLWRLANWDLKPFPAQENEVDAQLEHLSTRLIHQVLPVLSGGKFSSPDSLGYAKLPTGYAQVLEKVNGRGPRFDLVENEFLQFRQAQKELTQLALRLGLEQAGQVHPDNPFGMANLWKDDKTGTWIWLDTTPAIPHQGWVKPFFYFGFHKKIRHWFWQKETTFNRVHTGYFLTTLAKNKELFSSQEYEEIKSMLTLYENLWQEKTTSQKREIGPALRAFTHATKEFIPQLGKGVIGKSLLEPLRVTFDRKFRKRLALEGLHLAKKYGLITAEELEEGLNSMDEARLTNKERNTLIGIQAYYGVVWGLIKMLELSGYAKAISDSNKELAGLAFLAGLVVPPVLRSAGTMTAEAITKINLKIATLISLIPALGNYYPVPHQISLMTGGRSAALWHYTVRKIIAKLSKINPAGGWGTQFEAQLWEKLGKPLERLGTNNRKD